ncbi:MAG: hypothetical protein JNM27_10740 [Leptospirales bacterium]|nr:hypothetical protein [Leptospirales bacterium]
MLAWIRLHHLQILRLTIGGVWAFHGIYSKILEGIPRHRLIVARVLGADAAGPITILIGIGEVLIAVWLVSGKFPRLCALFQTLILASMNFLEIRLANDLLLSAPGMVFLNVILLSTVWYIALAPRLNKRQAVEEDRVQSS